MVTKDVLSALGWEPGRLIGDCTSREGKRLAKIGSNKVVTGINDELLRSCMQIWRFDRAASIRIRTMSLQFVYCSTGLLPQDAYAFPNVARKSYITLAAAIPDISATHQSVPPPVSEAVRRTRH